MSTAFGPSYARQYDALYGDKDYQAECDALAELMRRHARGATSTVLDLGCGTGTHDMLLSDRGHRVTGVDISVAMLDQARAKVAQRSGTEAPEFLEGDVRTVRLGRTFDVVLMMFAVLGYQTGNADVTAAMRTVRAHLRPGGLFICDVWFGPTVLSVGPSDRVKVVDEPGGQLHRVASGRLDVMHHTCRVEYRSWRTRGGQEFDRTAEEHTMRYFFPLELDHYLEEAGFRRRAMCPVGNLDAEPGLDSWNVWVVGEAEE